MITSDAVDQGTFASVAERLLAGDAPYVDVRDNKEPLFLYTLAIARWVSPVVANLLDVGWVLVAGAAAPVLLLVGLTILASRRDWRGLLKVAIGASGAVLTVLITLKLRHELRGFLKTILLNVTYSQNHAADGSLLDSMGASFMASFQNTAIGLGGLTALITTLLILVKCWPTSPSRARELSLATAAALAGALLVIGLTGVSYIHTQGLYLPGVLAVVLVASAQERTGGVARRGFVLLLTAVLLGGATHPLSIARDWSDMSRRLNMPELLGRGGGRCRIQTAQEPSGLERVPRNCHETAQEAVCLPGRVLRAALRAEVVFAQGDGYSLPEI